MDVHYPAVIWVRHHRQQKLGPGRIRAPGNGIIGPLRLPAHLYQHIVFCRCLLLFPGNTGGVPRPVQYQRQVLGIRHQRLHRPSRQNHSQQPRSGHFAPGRSPSQHTGGEYQPLIALDCQNGSQHHIDHQGNHSGHIHIGAEGAAQKGEKVLELVGKDAAEQNLYCHGCQGQQHRTVPQPPQQQSAEQPLFPAGKGVLMLPKPDVRILPAARIQQRCQGAQQFGLIHRIDTSFRAMASTSPALFQEEQRGCPAFLPV